MAQKIMADKKSVEARVGFRGDAESHHIQYFAGVAGGRRRESESDSMLAEKIVGSSRLVSKILFGDVSMNTLRSHGFPRTLVDRWGQEIARGRIPEGFNRSLQDFIRICEEVFLDDTKGFDSDGNRLWQE